MQAHHFDEVFVDARGLSVDLRRAVEGVDLPGEGGPEAQLVDGVADVELASVRM
jgi:hypothetical protein